LIRKHVLVPDRHPEFTGSVRPDQRRSSPKGYCYPVNRKHYEAIIDELIFSYDLSCAPCREYRVSDCGSMHEFTYTKGDNIKYVDLVNGDHKRAAAFYGMRSCPNDQKMETKTQAEISFTHMLSETQGSQKVAYPSIE
jgi:hypothetical protein